jgi:hypothetical protein
MLIGIALLLFVAYWVLGMTVGGYMHFKSGKVIDSIDCSKLKEALDKKSEYQDIIHVVLRSNAVNQVDVNYLHPNWKWENDSKSSEIFNRSNLDLRLMVGYGAFKDKFTELFKETFRECYPKQADSYLGDRSDDVKWSKFIEKYIHYISPGLADDLNKMVLEKVPVVKLKMAMYHSRINYELANNIRDVKAGIKKLKEIEDVLQTLNRVDEVVGNTEASVSQARRSSSYIKRNIDSKASSLISYISNLYILAYNYPNEYKEIKSPDYVLVEDDFYMLAEVGSYASFDPYLPSETPGLYRIAYTYSYGKDQWKEICRVLGKKNYKAK